MSAGHRKRTSPPTESKHAFAARAAGATGLIALYGTLRQGGRGFAELGLARKLRFVRLCRLRGLLYDLGDYPGLVEGAGTVRGELYRIIDGRVIAALDAYEGFDPADPAGSLFVREPVELDAPEGRAWAYRYNGPVGGAALVPSGDWKAHGKKTRAGTE